MDAATLTIDLDKRRCCYCSPLKNRCLQESCICYKQGRQCDSNCESSNWTGDCLNKPILKCRCTLSYNLNSRGKPELIFCNENASCPCYRYNEGCTPSCGCHGDCSNIVNHDENVLDYEHFPKLERPLCGCSCSSRGGCRKFKKCLCLQSLSYCGLGCKCKRECANTKNNFELSKPSKNYLFDPEQCPSGSMAILQILAANSSFQIEFATPNLNVIHAEEILRRVLTRALSVYTIPIQHVIIYTPNSPCFHQDCQPKCDIVDACINGKSCASALAILYRQLQKLTRNTHMEMTVRFLNPYVARGDLYTKRAILALMEGGIRVEPITIKEWSELMKDSVDKMKKRSLSTDRFFHHRNHEMSEANLTPTASTYNTLWNVADMDRFVRLSQYYINECRRTLGYVECYWTSAFHDLLKMTVLACAGAGEKLKHISIHLSPPISSSSTTGGSLTNKRHQKMKRQSRLSMNEENNDTPSSSSTKKPHRIRCHSGPSSFKNSKFLIVDEMVESISKSVNEMSLEDDYPIDTPTTANGSQQFDHVNENVSPPLILQNSEESAKMGNHTFPPSSAASSVVSLHAPAAALADKILVNLSGRNMVEAEQREIKIELVNAIDSIQQQLTALMQYLDQKIASVPV